MYFYFLQKEHIYDSFKTVVRYNIHDPDYANLITENKLSVKRQSRSLFTGCNTNLLSFGKHRDKQMYPQLKAVVLSLYTNISMYACMHKH